MNNPMEEGDGRTLDVMKEPSMNSPISVIEGEETTNKIKASCVEPFVNEPKRSQMENTCIFALKLHNDIAVVADGRVSAENNVGTAFESFEIVNDKKIKIVLTEECLITMSGDEYGCEIIAGKMKDELGRGALLSDLKDKFKTECVTRGAVIGLYGRDPTGVHMILIGDEEKFTEPTNVMLGNSNVHIAVHGTGSLKALRHFMKLRQRYLGIQLNLEKLILICQECVAAPCISKKSCGGLLSTGMLLNGKASLRSQPRSVLDFVTGFYRVFFLLLVRYPERISMRQH
jgi:hypothetical protein